MSNERDDNSQWQQEQDEQQQAEELPWHEKNRLIFNQFAALREVIKPRTGHQVQPLVSRTDTKQEPQL